jgi:surfeit locus 1 family protein
VRNLVGNRRFKPSIVGIVLTVIGIAGCFRLGVWQLDRAEEKRALMTAFASGAERAVRATGELGGLPRYQSIELTGRYDSQRQILLDNMPSARSRPGYHVLTPLQRESGDWVLVNRGWVPAGKTRAQLPDVRVDERLRIVRGQLDELPRPGIRLGSADANLRAAQSAVGSWPKVLNFPRQEELAAVLNRPVASSLVLLDPSQTEGYERVWQARFAFGPERHLAYAVQWFALLAAILVTFVVVSSRKVAKNDVG